MSGWGTGAVRLTSANALEIVAGYDVVVDGSDNFPTRYLVNDACVLTGRPNVYGSVYRWEGQLSVFAAEDGPCYRCLFREPPPPGLIPNCAEAGVFGALPGVIGAAQAMETVKLILGVGEPLVGRLQIFDALAYRWRELEIRRDPGCPVCGDEPTQTGLIDYEAFCGVEPEPAGAEVAVGRVEPDEFVGVMAGDPRPFLLDVREPMEWQVMNLAHMGAVHVPMGEVPDRVSEIPRDRPVVVYCHTGVRSLEVAKMLAGKGYEDVRNLEGGDRWGGGLRVERASGWADRSGRRSPGGQHRVPGGPDHREFRLGTSRDRGPGSGVARGANRLATHDHVA